MRNPTTCALLGPQASAATSAAEAEAKLPDNTRIIFVLGGPGSGKGTQCAKIVDKYGYQHLSAGDLLRDEVKSGSAVGKECEQIMKEGKLVPMEVIIGLLRAAMVKSGAADFLIDGFPRALDQAHRFEQMVKPCERVIFFDCPEEVMEARLLKRGETSGRADDNADTIRKRFKTFVEQSLPVIDHYEGLGKAHKISATRTPDEVFGEVQKVLDDLNAAGSAAAEPAAEPAAAPAAAPAAEPASAPAAEPAAAAAAAAAEEKLPDGGWPPPLVVTVMMVQGWPGLPAAAWPPHAGQPPVAPAGSRPAARTCGLASPRLASPAPLPSLPLPPPAELAIIFVLGGPGSGKGTQCAKIVEQYGHCHLSAGDLLRDEVKSGSAVGKECEQIMKEGKLVPMEVGLLGCWLGCWLAGWAMRGGDSGGAAGDAWALAGLQVPLPGAAGRATGRRGCSSRARCCR